MTRKFAGQSHVQDLLQLRDVQSGRELRTIALDWTLHGKQFYLAPSLRYCDHGKYLLAFIGLDALSVLDADTLQPHSSISIGNLSLTNGYDGKSQHFTDSQLLSDGLLDCSTNSDLAVLGFWGDGIKSIKLFDVEKGTEVADLSDNVDGRYYGDGLAISPDGSKIAVLVWKLTGPRSETIELIDTHTGKILKSLTLGDQFEIRHRLAFAGNEALIIGEQECAPIAGCEFNLKPRPRSRTLRIWNFGSSGEVNTLGIPSAETYRSFGASSDGKVIFAYTGIEDYCDSCNNGSGELKIKRAWLTVWHRKTRQIIVQSQNLAIDSGVYGGLPPVSYQEPPHLHMSANGKAVLAFAPFVELMDKTPHNPQVYLLP